MDSGRTSSLRKFMNRMREVVPHSSSNSYALHEEARKLLIDLNSISPKNDLDYKYRLLDTKKLISVEGQSIWRQYISGVKMLDNDSVILEHRSNLNKSISLFYGNVKVKGIISCSLKDVLQDIDIPHKQAGDSFLEQVRTSLMWKLACISESVKSHKKQEVEMEYKTEKSREYSDTLEQGPIELFEKDYSNGDFFGIFSEKIQSLSRFFGKLKDNARRYAPDLAPLLDHYVKIATHMAIGIGPEHIFETEQRSLQKIIDRLSPEEVIDSLSKVPVYIQISPDKTGELVGTPVVPSFQNQLLNDGYQRIWKHIIQSR